MEKLLHSQNGEAKNPHQQSARFWTVLRKHLAIFTEHYRQPMSELSVLAYAEDLSDLSPEQLDAACIEARRTSEFMPVSATIRNCLSEIRRAGLLRAATSQLSRDHGGRTRISFSVFRRVEEETRAAGAKAKGKNFDSAAFDTFH